MYIWPVVGWIPPERSDLDESFDAVLHDGSMKKTGSVKSVSRAAAVALGLIAISTGLSGSAEAAGDYGSKIFSVNDPFFLASDSNGRFSAQVSYGNGNPVAFSFVLSPPLIAIATSSMNCTAWQFRDGASTGTVDNHANIPAGYYWHWTFPTNYIGFNMEASGNCTFKVNSGGVPGTANVRFVFRYVVGDGGLPIIANSKSAETKSGFTSVVTISR
ncbi:hypothetical protein [Kitasatospora sp. NPDC058218]|uniref:hypothetical protein n=1 Tax=Kitasatospora sp. NPDC058218 TaxID=3346385 RepID=UPI0036D76302